MANKSDYYLERTLVMLNMLMVQEINHRLRGCNARCMWQSAMMRTHKTRVCVGITDYSFHTLLFPSCWHLIKIKLPSSTMRKRERETKHTDICSQCESSVCNKWIITFQTHDFKRYRISNRTATLTERDAGISYFSQRTVIFPAAIRHLL